MNNLLSWQLIFDEFKQRYPSICDEMVNWYASGYLKITIRLKDGCEIVYDYVNKRALIT